MFRQRLALLTLLLAAASARAEVIVVSPSDTFSVQDAVDAAADGDILLLKPNASPDPFGFPTTIDGKGLTLVAEGSVTVAHVIVRNLAAGQRVVLRGLHIGGNAGSFSTVPGKSGTVDVLNCAGPVWIDACELLAPDALTGCFGGCSQWGIDGLHVAGSADVVATDCSMVGGAGSFENCVFILQCDHSTPGGDGASVLDSRLALLRCTLTGGAGGGQVSTGSSLYAKASGRGLSVAGNSLVHLAGGQAQGGPQKAWNLGPGAGLKIADAAAWVQLRGTALLSGTGSPPAPPLDAPLGNFALLSAPPRGLQVSSPLRVDAPGEIHISALPGDLVAIFESPAGAWQSLPAKQGVFLLGAPVLGPVFAAVDVAGDWTLPFVGPHALPPGALGVTVMLQLLVKQGPTLLIEDVASCTLLDAAVP